MRWAALCLATVSVCASVAALAMPPYANELMLPAGGIAASPDEKPAVPMAARGQVIGVACANVERVASEAVRVVMYLAPDERSTGYIGVLATEQTITPGTVHVRIPDTPDLADHTVFVRVYFLDSAGRHTCDAGKVRIV
jgi:hypothetical protein